MPSVAINGQLLLSDFGIAVAAQSSRYQGQQEFGGTAAYASPNKYTVTVQNGNGRMLWVLTFTNITGDSIRLYTPTITLHSPALTQSVSPDSLNDDEPADNSCVTLWCDLSPNDTVDFTATFAFLPYRQVTYTISVEVQGFEIDVKLDPLDVTFS